jgi:hypothetical protein
MRTLASVVAALLILGYATSSSAAISLGQHIAAECAAATSCTTTTITTAASGSTFWVATCTTGTLAATPITDSKLNVWVSIERYTPAVPPNNCQRSYVSSGTGGASHTFTGNATTSVLISVWAIEILGASASTAIDKSARGSDSATPFDSPNTATLSQANELMVGVFTDNSTGGTCTIGAGNGFAITDALTNAAMIDGASETKVVATTTGDHAEFTNTGCGATTLDVAVDTFKQAAAGGVCLRTLLGVGC